MLSKKVTIEKDSRELRLSYRWMGIHAYFLLVFCFIWNGILAFMYSMMLGSDVPLFVLLFPSIHAAVGLGLAYYTACLFLNRTTLTVNRDSLSISHAPLPWLGAKTLKSSNIEQLYVKEKVNRGKNGTTVSYLLYAQMKEGKDLKIISGETLGDADDTKLVEREIEQFLGIRDRQVPGEYLGSHKPKTSELPREKRIDYNPTNLGLQNLLKGYVLTYDLKNWEVIYEGQYDWSSGESDKIYRLSGEGSDSLLLYVDQEMGLSTPYIEEKLRAESDARAFGMLSKETAPSELKFADKIYYKKDYSSGKFFASDSSHYSELSQWLYLSSDEQSSLRILQHGAGEVTVFEGKLAHAYEFTNILPSESSRTL